MLQQALVIGWLLTAQLSTVQCQGTSCQPVPGASPVALIVKTFSTQESCEGVRRQMQASGTIVTVLPGNARASVRQTTTYRCEKGD
jgi:hypothetical protein